MAVQAFCPVLTSLLLLFRLLVFFISHNRMAPPEETHPLALRSPKRPRSKQFRKHSFHARATVYADVLLHAALSLEINPEATLCQGSRSYCAAFVKAATKC